MSKMKHRLIMISIFAVLFVLTLSLAIGSLPVPQSAASAAAYAPTAIFSAGTGGEVSTNRPDDIPDEGDEEEGDEEDYFVQFSFRDEGKVHYRRDLALRWFEAAGEDAAKEDRANPGVEKYFSMTFAFASTACETHTEGSGDSAVRYKTCPVCGYGDSAGEHILADAETCPNSACGYNFKAVMQFKTLEIAFESTEENISKDGVATNVLYFEYTDGKLYAAVKNASFDSEKELSADDKTEIAYTDGGDITLALGAPAEGSDVGEYSVTLTTGGQSYPLDNFTNIGSNYLEYRSSAATTPQIPMTFTVTLPEAAENMNAPQQAILMKSLNGQSLKVNSVGSVEDDANPVLILDEAVYSFRLGQRFSLTYEAVDVCDDSVSVTRSYYMLKKETLGEGEEAQEIYHKPDEKAGDDYKTLTTSTFFMPSGEDMPIDEETGKPYAYVSIRFKLDDGTHSDYYVYLTWYAANGNVVARVGDEGVDIVTGYKCEKCGHVMSKKEFEDATAEGKEFKCPGEMDEPVKDAEGNDTAETKKVPCDATKDNYKELPGDNYFDYIKVDLEAEGPAYVGLEAHEAENDGEKNTNVSNWVENDEGLTPVKQYQNALDEAAEGLSAGDGAYLYLPSLRGLINSDYADYRNLRFSIYYYKPGTTAGGSASSATSLRYNNLRIEVDEVGDYRFRVLAQDASSNAMKYYDEDGELVTVTSSNIWDIEGIPEFHFFIDYDGPTIEEMEEQSEGYRERSYSVSSFDIVALEGYETEYSLYFFDKTKLGEHEEPTYSELVEAVKGKEELPAWIQDCLKPINVYNSEVAGDADEFDRNPDNAYQWNPDSSLSFVPQETGFYFVKLDVTDDYLVDTKTTAYQVINIRNPVVQIPGKTPWLSNNIAAIVLFSISAVLGVAIIVMCVVKPSDKSVEEVDLGSLKGKKKDKKE